MKLLNIFFAAIVLFALSSCGNFLKEYSQDLTYANKPSDLDEILMGDGYMNIVDVTQSVVGLGNKDGFYFPWLHILDDDTKIDDIVYNTQSREDLMQFFLWGEYPYKKGYEIVPDDTWARLYTHISVANVVLKKAEQIEGSKEEIERIKGESHFLRASMYYLLINLYAKPYNVSTASQDMGVPIKTTEYIEDIYFTRNSVAEVYELILNDLTKAAELLKGKKHKSIYRANYYATQALLSRIYLYMEEYNKSVIAADEAMLGNYALLDYRTLNKPDDYTNISTTYKNSPETIFSQGENIHYNTSSGIVCPNMFTLSENLISCFDDGDLRLKFVYSINWKGNYFPVKFAKKEDGIVSSSFLIRLPEIMLNKAEALAIIGEEGKARELINELREARFSTEKFQQIPAIGGADLVQYIRDERRRELAFECHRWFDLRRYGANVKFPFTKEIVHDYYTYNMETYSSKYEGSYKLNKYGSEPAYVLPIPIHVIEYNKGSIKDNEARPVRTPFMKE